MPAIKLLASGFILPTRVEADCEVSYAGSDQRPHGEDLKDAVLDALRVFVVDEGVPASSVIMRQRACSVTSMPCLCTLPFSAFTSRCCGTDPSR
jgi:hypothetical protein